MIQFLGFPSHAWGGGAGNRGACLRRVDKDAVVLVTVDYSLRLLYLFICLPFP